MWYRVLFIGGPFGGIAERRYYFLCSICNTGWQLEKSAVEIPLSKIPPFSVPVRSGYWTVAANEEPGLNSYRRYAPRQLPTDQRCVTLRAEVALPPNKRNAWASKFVHGD
jgi:hypothetical protein